jgi:hypothetical protein
LAGFASAAFVDSGDGDGVCACVLAATTRNKGRYEQTESHGVYSIHRFSSRGFSCSMVCIILIRRWLSTSVAKLNSSASCPAPAVEQVLHHNRAVVVLNHSCQKQLSNSAPFAS